MKKHSLHLYYRTELKSLHEDFRLKKEIKHKNFLKSEGNYLSDWLNLIKFLREIFLRSLQRNEIRKKKVLTSKVSKWIGNL